MSVIELSGVTLTYPVRNARTSSLRRQITRYATGGLLVPDNWNHLTIRALQNISLRLEEGQKLGVFGHNGSGKSTLLRVMAGVYEPTSGRVTINGKVSSSLDVSLGMDPEATGRQNIEMMAVFRGISLKVARAATDEIVDFSGLGPFIDLPVSSYSSGMRARLAFSVATSWQPDILLMDEWLGLGDEQFVARAAKRLQNYVAGARALAIASQNRGLLSDLCDKILVLHQGKVAAFGTPAEVWRAYPKPENMPKVYETPLPNMGL